MCVHRTVHNCCTQYCTEQQNPPVVNSGRWPTQCSGRRMIVCHVSDTACVSGEYLVKWQGLPYSECTQEDVDLIKQHFPVAVEEYNRRRKSSHLPSKNCKVCWWSWFLFVKNCKVCRWSSFLFVKNCKVCRWSSFLFVKNCKVCRWSSFLLRTARSVDEAGSC